MDAIIDSNEEENEDYSPTPAYKLILATPKPKACDPKVTLDDNYFTFLRPLTFDTKWFASGHTQVYSEDEMEIKMRCGHFTDLQNCAGCTVLVTGKRLKTALLLSILSSTIVCYRLRNLVFKPKSF